MSEDISVLGIAVETRGVKEGSDALDNLTRSGANAEVATEKLTGKIAGLAAVAKASAAAFGVFKIAEYAKDSTMLAARYETLGVAMAQIGKNVGYSSEQMNSFATGLQKAGISMLESRATLTQMAQAHIDLADATKLAAVAQGAAVVAGINSSEAMGRMIRGIQSGETETLRTIGINVNFEASYAKLAKQLGLNANLLTESEKAQARSNAVLERGADLAGVYEQAMGTAGKQLGSMSRYAEDLSVKLGGAFLEAFTVSVFGGSEALKALGKEMDELAKNGSVEKFGRSMADGLSDIVEPVKTASKFLYEHGAAVKAVAEAYIAFKVGSWAIPMIAQYASATAAAASYTAAIVGGKMTEGSARLAATAIVTASAEAEALATLAATNSQVAHARATVIASEGVTQLALAENMLVPALQRQAAASAAATAATAANAEAMAATAISSRAAGAASSILGAATAALGGPIGVVIALLGTAATAWSIFGEKGTKAASDVDAAMDLVARKNKERKFGIGEVGALTAGAAGANEQLAAINAQIKVETERLSAATLGGASRMVGAGAAGTRLARLKTEADALSTKITAINADLVTAQKEADKATSGAGKASSSKRMEMLASEYAPKITKAETLAALEKAYKEEQGLAEGNAEKLLAIDKTYNTTKAGIDERFKTASTAKTLSEYDRIAKAASEKIAAQQIEVSLGEGASASMKEYAKLQSDIANGYVKLTAAEKTRIAAMYEKLGIGERELELKKLESQVLDAAYADEQKRADATLNSAAATAADAEKIRAHTEELGMSEAAISSLNAARLDDTIALKEHELAELDATGQCTAYSEALRANVEALKERKAALDGQSTKQAFVESAKESKKAAEKAAEDWKKTSDKIGDSITDALMRGFESGKGFAETLRDTVENMFNTLVLRPVIQATVIGGLSALGLGSATAGETGIGGLANLVSTGNSLFNIGSTISSGAGALPMTTTIAEGVGALGGDSIGTLMSLNPQWGVSLGTSIGTAAGTAFATTATGAAVSTTTAAGVAAASAGSSVAAGGAATAGLAAVPVAGWVALAAIAAYSIFGGSDAGPKYEGNYFGVLDNAGGSKSQQYATWWSHGTGYSGDSADGQLAQMAPSLTTAINGLVTSLGGTAAGIGVNYGFNHDDSGGANDQISTVVSDSKGNIAYENSYSMDSGGYKDALALEMQRMTLGAIKAADGIKPIFKELVDGIDLTAASAETITKAISDLQGIVSLRAAFENLNLDADDLSMTLISASGGVSAMASSLEGYYAAYFSEAEKTQNITDSLTKSFSAAGIAMPASKEAFRAVVEGLDLTTASGQTTFAAMMKLAPSFATVADAAEAAEKSAKAEAAAKADAAEASAKAARAAMQDTIMSDSNSAVDAALAALERSVSAQKATLENAYTAQKTAWDESVSAATDIKATLTGLADALGNAVRSVVVESDTLTLARRASAQMTINSALVTAQSGGSLAPLADAITGAITDLSAPSDHLYSSFEEYSRAQGRANAVLSELSKNTLTQKSVAEKTLDTIKDASDAADAAYEAQIAALDKVLNDAQLQIDALNRIDTSVVSVATAMAALASAIATMGAVNSALKPPVVSTAAATTAIVSAYQTNLGRAPDAGGLTYWSQQAAGGTSISSISSAIANSAEAQVNGLYQSILGRTADAAGAAYWTGLANSGMSSADIANAIKNSDEYKNSHANGLERVPYDGYKATLHAGEAVVDAQSTRAISRYFGGGGGNSNNEALILEIKALREEVSLLRYEARATATNTNKTAKSLEKFDIDGMPAERIAA